MSTNILRAHLKQSQTADEIVEICWTSVDEGTAFEPYFLDLAQLSRATERIRSALDTVQAAMHHGTSITEAEPLRELARNGLDLYGVVMTCSPRKSTGQNAAVTFRQWFESVVIPSKEDWRIEMLVEDVSEVVPWGLVFCPSPSIEIDDLETKYDDYVGFWCNRFRLATFKGVPSPQASILPSDHFRFSLIVEEDESKLPMKVQKDLKVEQTRSHAVLEERMFGERFDALEFLMDHDDFHHFVYMSLQVDGDHNDHGSLRSLRETIDGNLFVFLDGDAIIRGDRDQEWLFTLFNSGWAGLIAAETDITNDNLKLAGWDFLKEVLTYAQPLAFSIHEARRSFWPGSILYGVYSDPMQLSLDPRPPTDFTALDKHLQIFREQY